MSDITYYTIESTITFSFETPQIRDISYDSYLPEYEITRAKRSKIVMQKIDKNILEFHIYSKDITAFRASMNDIITFGKIIENTLELIDSK
ncbi:MAG: hypothetical protein EU518_01145 [Promethearchaeota archaeon]|nr:MAG: hypothetical protein EU518_01145 [Candidatus Lokiarchaeota archaeon]